MADEAAINSRKIRTIAALAFAGMLVGAAAGFGFGRLLKHGLPGDVHLAWSDVGALAISMWMLVSGLFIIIAGSHRRLAGRMVDPGEPRPATPAQMRFFRAQALVLILAGVLLALPVLAGLLPGATSPAVRIGTMVALIVLFGLQVAWNIGIWRRADEFMRALIAESSIVCFWVLQSALLLWAAGEKLGLLPTASLWDALVVLMAVYLVVNATLSVRKGFT